MIENQATELFKNDDDSPQNPILVLIEDQWGGYFYTSFLYSVIFM